MKMSTLIRLLTDYILQYGDRDILTVQYHKDHNDSGPAYTYGGIGNIVDYEDGTVGLLGDEVEDVDND